MASLEYRLIGIREFRNSQTALYDSREMSQYTIFLRSDLYQIYTITMENFYDCSDPEFIPSTRGELSDIKSVEDVGTLHWVPKVHNQQVIIDYVKLEIRTMDGVRIAWVTSDGPCSSIALFDPKLFVKTMRAITRRPVYVFQGPSCTGKSFIASNLSSLKVYETDSNETIPETVTNYNVIVVGNKYPDHLSKVTELVSKNDDVERINVSFWKD